MVFFSFKGVALVATTLLFSSASAAPTSFNSKLETFKLAVERSNTITDIVGIQSGLGPATGQVPLRQDFNVFAQDAASVNLYLLALNQLQTTSQSNSLSFYQIAGIHGRPYVSWEGVGGGNNNGGYCTHTNVLFASWHRPYLALYEQTLWNAVQSIAASFPAGSAEQAAAPTWRMPYWDWARNATVPSLISAPQVSVVKPSGTVTINNPLAGYTFAPLNPSDLPDAPFNTMPATLRNPNSAGVSDIDGLNANLENIGTNLKQRVYNVLTTITDYDLFSSKIASNGQADSLEGIHDTIHAVVGGDNGNMAWVDYAAFDPIFFLHHTNIDRLYAIWQAITGVDTFTGTAQYGTYGIKDGTKETQNTGLSPFYKSGTTFWTADSSKDTTTFGYAYPEVEKWNLGGNSLSAVAIAAVNSIYGTGAPAGILSSASSQAATATSTSKTSTKSITTASTLAATKVTTTSTPAAIQVTTTSSPAAIRVTTTSAPVIAPEITTSSTPIAIKITTTAPASTSVVPSSIALPSPTPTPIPSKSSGTSNDCEIFSPCWWNNWWNTLTQGISGRRHGQNHKRQETIGEVFDGVVGDVTEVVNDFTTDISHGISQLVDAIPNIGDIIPHTHKLVSDNHYNEYLANIKVSTTALNGTFGIYVFLGDYSSDPAQWNTDDNLVGAHYIFTAVGGGHQALVSGQVPLTGALINRVVAGDLASLDTYSVIPYLSKNLHWTVKGATGCVPALSDVQDLDVQVVSSHVKLAACDEELPTWGAFASHTL